MKKVLFFLIFFITLFPLFLPKAHAAGCQITDVTIKGKSAASGAILDTNTSPKDIVITVDSGNAFTSGTGYYVRVNKDGGDNGDWLYDSKKRTKHKFSAGNKGILTFNAGYDVASPMQRAGGDWNHVSLHPFPTSGSYVFGFYDVAGDGNPAPNPTCQVNLKDYMPDGKTPFSVQPSLTYSLACKAGIHMLDPQTGRVVPAPGPDENPLKYQTTSYVPSFYATDLNTTSVRTVDNPRVTLQDSDPNGYTNSSGQLTVPDNDPFTLDWLNVGFHHNDKIAVCGPFNWGADCENQATEEKWDGRLRILVKRLPNGDSDTHVVTPYADQQLSTNSSDYIWDTDYPSNDLTDKRFCADWSGRKCSGVNNNLGPALGRGAYIAILTANNGFKWNKGNGAPEDEMSSYYPLCYVEFSIDDTNANPPTKPGPTESCQNSGGSCRLGSVTHNSSTDCCGTGVCLANVTGPVSSTGVCYSKQDLTNTDFGGVAPGAGRFALPDNVCSLAPGSSSEYVCKTAIGNINTSAAGFTDAILRFILSIAGGIAVLLIIISGYRLMVSQGNPENIKNAKDQLTAAIVGLLFVIFSLVILQVIGVNILGLPGFQP